MEVVPIGLPTAFVADVGGLAVDQDAVWCVTDADLRALLERLLGQVDLGESIVLVQQRVRALAVLRERNAARIGRAATPWRFCARSLGASKNLVEECGVAPKNCAAE